jgi:hypothetical protein
MLFKNYTITARIYPAIITSFPLVILSGFIINSDFIKLFTNFNYLKIASNISMPFIIVYLLAQINRFIAKEIFEKKYFKNELYMPTTNFMLFENDEYSDDFKLKIRDKIQKDFDITLPSKEQERGDNITARKQIVEAIGLVRNKVGKGKLLLQHNIEYGFVRNLIGGSTIAFLVSLLNIGIFKFYLKSDLALNISIATTIIFLAIIIISKFLINRYGILYAKRLFQEYMSGV